MVKKAGFLFKGIPPFYWFSSIQNFNVSGKKENGDQSVNGSKHFGLAFFRYFPKDTEGVGKVIKYV